jgi:hypothetical protein
MGILQFDVHIIPEYAEKFCCYDWITIGESCQLGMKAITQRMLQELIHSLIAYAGVMTVND